MPRPYNVQDKYFHEAKKQGYRARSAFKLLEIQEKMNIIRKGDHVLDLGCYPGSWLQVVSDIVGDSGLVLGVDLEETKKVEGVKTLQADVFADETIRTILAMHAGRFDVITADMAPNTSGIKDVDQYRSVELNVQVLMLCRKLLKPGGSVVSKLFVGADFQQAYKPFKDSFQALKQVRPDATRDRSIEVYLVGKCFNS